ncbi:hypothetical protein [Microbacterium sp. USTB-Y]|uniref:hypothetical protein n=1 Tax=Microbacterium sp. USTB-Y TaxID=2823692 RepID=UPI00203CA370|nr:hypothetical protein [Microbacterium sp. USTB-Y]
MRPPLSGAPLDRHLRRVITGRRKFRSHAFGRFLGAALIISATLSGLVWITVASIAGIVRILLGV